MWTKSFRKCLIGAIYQHLFWKSFSEVDYTPNWEDLTKVVYKEDEAISIVDLESAFQTFLTKKEEYSVVLHKYITRWDKTFDIMKAALFCFMIEYAERKGEDDLHILGVYIKFAQDYAGGENPALIHAIISKMIEENEV
jgi:transcription termination factor NusB